MMFVSFLILLQAALAAAAPHERLSKRLDNGVGRTPAMGFNNYNAGLNPSADTALTTASLFVSLGLADLGYEYINMDDGWPNMTRDADGNLQPDSTKWPNGIANVTSQLHDLGLKFGLYGDSGTYTCAGYPGSAGYETQDADTLAEWGVDFWKYDFCSADYSVNSSVLYNEMRDAMNATGREIYFAICNWGYNSVWEWGANTGNSWRVGSDISDSWSVVASIAGNNADLAAYAGPGGFNDFDMLEVGNGGLTTEEERAHFGLWAIAKSPLLIGTDLSKISDDSLAILKNEGAIAISQDSLGIAAAPFQPTGASAIVDGTLYPYWSGELSDGYVIGLVAVDGAETLTVDFSDVPGLGAGTYSWTEVYSGDTGSGSSVSATLAEHDMAIFKVTTS